MPQQQSGQPVGGQKNKDKFNWTKLIIIFLIITSIVMFFLWQEGVFTPKYKKLNLDELFKKVVKEKKEVEVWKDDSYNHLILYKFKGDKDWKTLNINFNYFSRILLNNDFKVDSSSEVKTSTQKIYYIFKGSNIVGSKALEKPSIVLTAFLQFLPLIILLSLTFWMFKKANTSGGGINEVFSGGKNQARKIISNKKFSDVAGQEEVKEEVAEVVDFLKKPKKYKAAGARVPKGIMLGGPPGTGKTLIAKAVAGEAKVPFYFISASNFVEMFAGLGAKRAREMFIEARKAAPSILFIDELDAVGRKRGSSFSGNDEREQTLNQILVEMDGMDENSGLLVIAATNRPDVLDPALLRPGRFDRRITVALPDIKEREAILRLHARGKRISPKVDFKNIAKRIPRFSGAQIENVINEAALLSVRENSEIITLEQIDEAIDRVNAGPAKKHRVITPEENRMVAIHEAGHAVTGLKVKDADIVQKITIIPRGDAGGYTLRTPAKEKYNYSKTQLEGMIISALGGRAAEQVEYGVGEVSTGASDDIEKATAIARAMVTQYGMSKLGPIAYERAEGSQYLGQERVREYSDALAERIDEAIRDIIIVAEKKAIEIIKKHQKLLMLIVEELLEKETIVVEEIDYINKHLKRPPKNLVKKNKKLIKKSLNKILEEVDSASKKKK